MNTKENLIQYKDSLTPEERRERASKAGIASGEARRKRRLMKDMLSDFMTVGVTEPELIEVLESHGLPCTQEAAILFAAIKKAQRGDIEAARFIRDTLGEKPREDIAVSNMCDVPMETLDLRTLSNEELRQMIAKRVDLS